MILNITLVVISHLYTSPQAHHCHRYNHYQSYTCCVYLYTQSHQHILYLLLHICVLEKKKENVNSKNVSTSCICLFIPPFFHDFFPAKHRPIFILTIGINNNLLFSSLSTASWKPSQQINHLSNKTCRWQNRGYLYSRDVNDIVIIIYFFWN